ncbi:hypothetical protein PUN28_020700 [Cardiocondyla obscurior]|uniref:Uncharacterized protein n=1 Tax=Cardiocondyla obscurior TaxID=286306 RepID=A0AAW2E8Y6_9HYME
MNKQDKLRELFGSLSEDSDSPASPPPGAWPPPIDPGRRYRVPRIGTSIQRGDGSRDRHTRWMGEPPPATPRTTQKNRGQTTATTTQSDPTKKKTAGITAAAKMAAPGSSVATRPATGGPGKMARERPPQDRPPATASTRDKTHQVETTSRTTTAGSGSSVPTSLAESGAGTRGQKLTRGHRTKAPPPVPPGLRRGSTTRRGPTIRAVQIVQPPGTEIKTVASIMAAGKPVLTATPSEIRQTDARAAASSATDETTAVTMAGRRENTTAGPSSAPAAASPPSLATTSTPGAAPLILPPPAPPAYGKKAGSQGPEYP